MGKRSIQSIKQMAERVTGAVSEKEDYGFDGYHGASSACVRMTQSGLRNLRGRFPDLVRERANCLEQFARARQVRDRL